MAQRHVLDEDAPQGLQRGAQPEGLRGTMAALPVAAPSSHAGLGGVPAGQRCVSAEADAHLAAAAGEGGGSMLAAPTAACIAGAAGFGACSQVSQGCTTASNRRCAGVPLSTKAHVAVGMAESS